MCTRTSIASFLVVPVLLVTGCGDNDAPSATSNPTNQSPVASSSPELNTFISDWIQIDVLSGGPGDANLVQATDADGTASINLPAGGSGSYIDWQDLWGNIANHRLIDTDDPVSGLDRTAFPGSNSCVGPANVLSKMDLTYVGVASNSSMVYLAALRSANNGDAGYYWLFTRKAPHRIPGAAPCSTAQELLSYDISGPDPATGAKGDVLIGGHFKPSSAPLLTVYTATRDQNGVVAVDAINFASSLWQVSSSGVAAVGVNTTVTSPGDWGTDGVKSLVGSNLGETLFAEAAVPLGVFTGGSSCGETYYGSVITRSSGSGGTSPDLKDLAGPARFNFGSLEIKASLTPTCDMIPSYGLDSATGPGGEPIASPHCLWTFDDRSAIVETCSGSHPFAVAGAHHGTVTVTDPASGCSRDFTTPDVNVYPRLEVNPEITGSCSSSFAYRAQVSGGTPAGVSYSWTFGGPGILAPPTSTDLSGTVAITEGWDRFSGDVTVTDLRTDGPTCTALGRATGPAYLPLAVGLHLRTDVLTCSTGLETDAVTYVPVASGGNGNYAYTWNGYTCTGSSCTMDPSDSNLCLGPISLSVSLSDSSGICPRVTSETETYTKVTTISATDNRATDN